MAIQMTRLQKARSLMLVKHPFFASLMLSMPLVETDHGPSGEPLPTAATDMKTLYVNPAFVDTIDDKVLLFVLAHEIMHTALEHGLRKQSRVHMRWNVACDYAINLILKESGFAVWDQALLDAKYKDMSADQIYNLLSKEEDEARQQQKQQQQGQGQGQGQDQGQSQSQPGQQPGQGQGQPDPNAPPQQGAGGGGQPQDDPTKTGAPGNKHHSPMLGDLADPPQSGDPMAEDRLARDIQQRVAQAATVARMTGNLSGSLERFVKEVLEPKVPWQHIMRHFMTETTDEDEDWSHRNRRFRIYLPTNHSEKMGEFVAIGDSSGSCFNDMERYFAEFLAVAEDLKPDRIRLVWADTKVKHVQEFEMGDEIELQPKGFGGTDMRVPLKHVEEFEPQVVVLFTDGETPWPKDPPPYPLIVCCTTGADCPHGEVIRI